MEAVPPVPDLMTTERRNLVARVVRETGQQLRRFIRARVPSDPDAEDILQDVWQRLLTTLEAGPVEQLGAWLYTVARHRIVDRYRRPPMASLEALAADDGEGDALAELADGLLRDDDTPRTELTRRLFWEQLHAALAGLPEAQRQVFVWHELEGLSFQEIAALTGENPNTLLARKHYAVRRLRRHLAPFYDELLP